MTDPKTTDSSLKKATLGSTLSIVGNNLANAQTVSYMPNEKSDNYVFYNVSEDKFKKSKLFGFLKKVKRVIERKSPFNHNDNKEVVTN